MVALRRCVMQGEVSAFLGFSSQWAACMSTYSLLWCGGCARFSSAWMVKGGGIGGSGGG